MGREPEALTEEDLPYISAVLSSLETTTCSDQLSHEIRTIFATTTGSCLELFYSTLLSPQACASTREVWVENENSPAQALELTDGLATGLYPQRSLAPFTATVGNAAYEFLLEARVEISSATVTEAIPLVASSGSQSFSFRISPEIGGQRFLQFVVSSGSDEVVYQSEQALTTAQLESCNNFQVGGYRIEVESDTQEPCQVAGQSGTIPLGTHRVFYPVFYLNGNFFARATATSGGGALTCQGETEALWSPNYIYPNIELNFQGQASDILYLGYEPASGQQLVGHIQSAGIRQSGT